ncbi:mRNA cleavage and polyadenylation factor subunit [Steccherinum ochraceum]|uniref:mRNA cleavage and polyadenylation factor subunit n=1 Tax=Steccherinum ochraceum TaxID=92696 RepID=A0A4R0S340_9APHY|nr:mRNA cleavage and polyadenylation factor subunit [Steccherinum ochraceum]
MHAVRHEILPPSGVEFTACLKLTPSTAAQDMQDSAIAGPSQSPFGKALYNVVVARSNSLRIFEVRQELAPISTHKEDERERRASVRKGTEAFEGEVEMDASGEGFVNMGAVKSTGQNGALVPPTIHRLYFVREHRLHGIVTGMERVRIVSSMEDGLDRLLVSFKDAKIALLEWSDATADLLTVSIHTYERAPQLMSLDASQFRSQLRADPQSRCAALSLPKDALAILPFYQSQAELDVIEQETQTRDVPYSPSFVLDLTADVDERIRHVIDFAFLPGFNSPTVAVLFQRQQTWTGRLKEFKDTVGMFVFTMDLVTRNCPVITAVENLPYDCSEIIACPSTLGGVIVTSSNSVIHIDQTARRFVLPVNGWPPRVSDSSAGTRQDNDERNLQLEGSKAIFVDDRTLFIVMKDGTVYPLEISAAGRTVSKMTLSSPAARTAVPSVLSRISDDLLFVGSTVGPSVLLKTARVEVEIDDDDVTMDAAPAAVVDREDSMELDDDDDIYGPSNPEDKVANNGSTNGGISSLRKRTVVHLSLSDSIPAYGSINDFTFSLTKLGDRLVPEVVAATGSGMLGGFTLFQRDLPTRVKRKVHAIGGGRGIWSLPVRQAVKVNGATYERPTNPHYSLNDAVIISTDANPSPGLSRISSRSLKNDLSITTRIPGTTVGAAPFFQGTAILHVMSNAIRVLEPDGTERQIIKDLDGNLPRPKIRYCGISDPFVLIIREDDSLGLFIGESERGKIRRKDMSPMGEKTSRYIAGCFYADSSGIFQSKPNAAVDGSDKAGTATLQAAMNAGANSQWLLLCRPQGVMEIWTLPKLTLIFSSSTVASLDSVLVDSGDPPALSIPTEPPRKPQELDIEQIILAPLGESSPKPHLLVFLRSGQFAIYQAVPSVVQSQQSVPATRVSTLMVRFVKVVSRNFDIRPITEEVEKSVLAEQKRISRLLIPFVTSPAPGRSFTGVFFTGDRPCWILCTDKGGVKMVPSSHSVVHAFTACSLWESKGDFLLYSEEGPTLEEWMPNVQFDQHLPSRTVPKPRAYSNVVFEPTSALLVAASVAHNKFASYDDDGNTLWEPDAPDVSYPYCETSTLELISPDSWTVMDGFEFAPNEFVTCIDCVTLETSSTEAGTKDFIAVGTTINRGEDLAIKGAVYIFEVVEVVPDHTSSLKRWYRFKLHCRDDAKGPVTALCGMNGYLVSSMGQKIFVRAFDLDERLVGVAFLDVGMYVTSLRAVKNLLVIGDAVKSTWLVAFQEDPYKLAVLAKDIRQLPVTCADLFFADNRVSVVSGDEEGVIRIYEYDPHDPEAKGGERLMCRTEFHGQGEYRSSYLIARRIAGPESDIPEAKLIFGGTDGSLSSLTHVDEAVYKRLQLLQGQLTRNVQHLAGLNPKAFRIVRNDYMSKPLTKGILDGNLLAAFDDLPIAQQNEVTRQIGTERTTVAKDWLSLSGVW